MPKHQGDEHEYTQLEPEILDGNCSASDLAFALEHLRFARNGLCTLRLDRDVARFLVDALRPHAARAIR